MKTFTSLSIPTADPNATLFEYAGWVQRLCALWVDAAILGAIQWPFGHMFGIWLGAGSVKEVVNFLFAVVIWWLYFPWFESSEHQATPGKRMIGIVVVDLQANQLTFARASVRALRRWLNTLTGIGYLMMTFTPRKQALHDLIAGTVVIPGSL